MGSVWHGARDRNLEGGGRRRHLGKNSNKEIDDKSKGTFSVA